MELTNRGKLYWKLFGLASLLLLIYMCLPFIDVMLYSVFIYYISRPVYKMFYEKTKRSNLSAIASLLTTVLPVMLILGYTAFVAAYELSNFVGEFGKFIPETSKLIEELSKLGEDLTPEELWGLVNSSGITATFDALIKQLGGVGNALGGIAYIGLQLFLVFTISFYLLKEGGKFRSWAAKTACSGDPQLCEDFLSAVDGDLHKVFFGNILVAALTSGIAIVLFYALNSIAPAPLAIPHPFLLGLLCGIAIFVPAVGIKLIWVPLWIYLGFQAYLGGVLLSSLLFLALFAIVVFLLADLAPDLVLRPYISSKKIKPGVMLLSYIFGIAVFGFMGLFLGPMIVVFVTNFILIVLPKVRSEGAS